MKLELSYRFDPRQDAGDTPARSYLCVWAAALTVLLGVSGCSSRAHSDLYQQRMASEIRVLEDQLYDADYQNRVLHQKLERYENKVQSSRIPTPAVDQEVLSAPIMHDEVPSLDAGLQTETIVPLPYVDSNSHAPVEAAIPEPAFNDPSSMDSFEIPNFEMGEPFDPNASGSTILDSTPSDPGNVDASDDASGNGDEQALPSPQPLSDPPEVPTRKPKVELLPPPSTPMPPGREQVKPDPIIPGDPAPPAREGDKEAPSGQIELPDSVQSPTRIPEAIKLHQTLSMGHHDGTKLDGATLVVNAVDALGRRVNLNDFEIDATLSVVVLDPERSPAEAKLGRWDFDADQVAAMISDDQGKGIEIPIRFASVPPVSDKVIVHVRLRGEEDEMRCNEKLDLRERTAESPWTPRSVK